MKKPILIFFIVLYKFSFMEIYFESIITINEEFFILNNENDSIIFNKQYNLQKDLALISVNKNKTDFQIINGSLCIIEEANFQLKNFRLVFDKSFDYIFILNNSKKFTLEVVYIYINIKF